MASLDVFEAIRFRRSIRRYKLRDIGREKFVIESLLKKFYILSIGRL